MTFKAIKIWVLLLCSVFTVATFAQNSNSTIKGTVQDASGAVVPGATVNLTNAGTGQTLTTTSKGDGYYVFTNLSPANYKVAVTMQGFAQWVGVLTLRVSQDAEVDPKLTAASVSTQVTVHDVTPIIDRVNPTISDVKNATAIETVPVLNRNILGVLAFSPGVVAGGIGGSGAGNTRINGMPPGSVDFLVDGQTMANRNTNELQTNPQPSTTFQEVKVITSNGNAEYSRPGIVELVTKSGTNQFHGQIFELNQNNHLQAKVFNQNKAVPYLQHNEYGFQVGGPIWIPKIYNGRNKTFFFFDAERIQQAGNAVVNAKLPTTSELQGNLSDVLSGTTGEPLTIYDPTTTGGGPHYARSSAPFAGNIIPANRLNAITQKIFGLTQVDGLVPYNFRPNVPGAIVSQNQPNYSAPNAKTTTNNKLYTAKLDQIFGPNRLAARYTYTDNKQLVPHYYALEDPTEAEYGGHNGSLTFTEVIGPRAINVAHVGIQYDNHVHSGPTVVPDVAAKLGLPTYQTSQYWPQFYYNSSYYGPNTDTYWTGIDRGNPKDYPDQTITANDQFSYNKGNHQLKFGFEYNNYRITTAETGQPGGNYRSSGYFTALQDPTQPDGVAAPNTGMALADFLLGDMDQIAVQVYPVYHTRQSEYDAYGQDDWRVSQKLTLNLGLRYEYWTAFSDASGLTATFDPNVQGGMVVYQGSGDLPAQTTAEVYGAFGAQGMPIESAAKAGYPLSLFNMPKDNFEPRVGFAYQLNDKTVLRGGYGIYHFIIPLISYQQATRKDAPFYYQAALLPGEVNGVIPNRPAAELEFPNTQPQYGGALPDGGYPPDEFMLGSSTFTIDPTNAAASIKQNNGFGFVFLDPNYKPSRVQEYNLTLSQELPWNTGFQLSYIGNHSNNLLMIDPINTEIPRLLCSPQPDCEISDQQRRLYPVFSSPVNEYEYNGYANTNELQAQLTHTFGNNLTLQTYFTWMKALTTSEYGLSNAASPAAATPGGGTGATGNTMVPAALTPGYNTSTIGSGAPISERIRAVYSNDPTLPTKTYQFNAHYQLPVGKGQRFLGNSHGILNALVSGYNLSTFFLWHSGFYFSPYFSTSATNVSGQSINLAPGKTGILPPGQRTSTMWFNASVYDPSLGAPYAGQTYILGTNKLESDFRNNIPPNYMTGPGYNRLDATVYKVTPIWRDLSLDFEAQFLNVYNHQNLGIPSKSGNITTTAGGTCVNGDCPRTIQLQAKILF